MRIRVAVLLFTLIAVLGLPAGAEEGTGDPCAPVSTDILIVGHDVPPASGLPHPDPGDWHPTLIRANRAGEVLWEKPIPLLEWGGNHQRYADRNFEEDALYLATQREADWVGGLNRVLKFDACGDVEWDLPLSPESIFVSADPVAGGAFVLETGTPTPGLLVKLDGTGEVLWTVTDPALVGGVFVSANPRTGGVYVATSATTLKFDRDGTLLWTYPIPTGDGRHLNADPIDGGVYVSYGTYGRNTGYLDADGNLLWERTDYPSGFTYGRAVSPGDGSLFIGSGWSGRLARLSMDNVELFNVPRPDYNENLAAATEDDSVYVGDFAQRGIVKYDGAGNELWSRQYGPPTWIGYYGILGVYTGMPSAATDLGFEVFAPEDHGTRFGVDVGVEYAGYDWGYTDPVKQETWGSWTLVDSSVEVPGAGGSRNWFKARAADVGKGAKITRQEGFVFASMKLYTDDRPPFLDRVRVTYRTLDNVTSPGQVIDLEDFEWITVTAADLGVEGLVLKAMWFNGPWVTSPNAAKFGLDDFEYEQP